MKVAAVFLAMIMTASAFVPTPVLKSAVATRTASKSSLNMFNVEDQLGVLKPVGFFDPLKLSKGITEEKFLRWRTVEIKHGRVCMMAFLGFIWQQGVGHLPGYLSNSEGIKFSDVPNGVAAITAVPALGWAQILWFVGLIELGPFSLDTMKNPGQFDFFKPGKEDNPDGYPGLTDENRAAKLTIELQNGRLAMLGVLGILMGDVTAPGTMGLPTADGIGLF
jgi:hypothetical protein